MRDYIKNRFYAKVSLPNENGCMNWIGNSLTTAGYGQFSRFGSQTIKAHRYSYELFVGAIPTGLCVIHSCDNPLCLAPSHLSIGTQLENLIDARKKGRMKKPPVFRGELNNQAKLNETQVIEIKGMLAKGISMYKIADMYKVTRPMIGNIKHGRNWKHVS